jgi:hypothetical protein
MFRIVSIIESFVVDGLVTRFEPHVPPPRGPILEDVYNQAEDAATASWSKLENHYKKWFAIKLTGFSGWRQIQAMIDIRNVVAHGRGQLTRRMARKNLAQLGRDFATVGVAISGNSILVPDLALRTSSIHGREFIFWLDNELAKYDVL